MLRILAAAAVLFPLAAVMTQDHKHDHDHAKAHAPTIDHSFEDVERWVEVFESADRAAWQKPSEIPAALGLKEGMTVADIGAGTGYFERHFAQAVGPAGRVYAADIEPKMVEYMKARAVREKTPQVIPVLAAADDPRLPDAALDRIFICNTWHHIGDRVEYLERLRRALRGGGRLAIVDFHKRDLPVGPPTEHKLSREEIVAELAEAGWSLAGESDLLPYQYLLIFTPPAAP